MKELLKEIPVPPKMIRNFAIATVLITGIIAMFADGERREAIAQEVEDQRQQIALQEAEAQKLGPKEYKPPVIAPAGTGAGFGSEGPVDPGGDGGGGGGAAPSSSGAGFTAAAGAYDYGTLPPDVAALRQGKLPPKMIGPAWQPPKKVATDNDRSALLRAAEDRAGQATPARPD
ncbi:MAG: hypothetical protein ACKOPO_07440 [Novosphingobium sp.]